MVQPNDLQQLMVTLPELELYQCLCQEKTCMWLDMKHQLLLIIPYFGKTVQHNAFLIIKIYVEHIQFLSNSKTDIKRAIVYQAVLHKQRQEDRQQITSGFAKLGGGVTTQTAAGTKTASDSPDGVRLSPQLRKAAVPLCASRQECGKDV